MEAQVTRPRKQINMKSLCCGVANFAAGGLLLINPVFASPSNLNHIQSGSWTVTWFAVPFGFLVLVIAFVQIIVALVRRRVQAAKTEMNKFAYLAIGFAAYFIPTLFITNAAFQAFNIPVFWILALTLAMVFARKSRVQNLGSILISSILLLTACSMALIIAELI